jgi:transcriptional regulator with XRE-family HTH domain
MSFCYNLVIMKFTALQENLRKALLNRIESGKLTGLKLAKQIGVEQGHISNFLNHKRGLSLEAMDRVLSVQKMSALDLIDAHEISKRATMMPKSDSDFENVVLVDAPVASRASLIMQKDVKDTLKFKKNFLKRLRTSAKSRDKWHRFVLIKVDARNGMSMFPRLLPGATVLIDRHYNRLKPYRRGATDRTMYAVRTTTGCTVGYVEKSGRNLVLRPHNQEYPVQVINVSTTESPWDVIVGRVCHVGIET